MHEQLLQSRQLQSDARFRVPQMVRAQERLAQGAQSRRTLPGAVELLCLRLAGGGSCCVSRCTCACSLLMRAQSSAAASSSCFAAAA